MKAALAQLAAPELEYAYQQAKRYLRRPYVTGVGIGRARRKGAPAEMAVCIFVSAKKPEQSLPRRSLFPRMIAGVPVDVVVCRPRAHHQAAPAGDAAAAGIIQPGMMIGDGQNCGTVGLIARSIKNKRELALTCAHVLPGAAGTQVYQPGDAFPQNQCGTRAAGLWNISGDVALAHLSRPANNIVAGTTLRLRKARAPVLGEMLQKHGFVSGHMPGRVSHLGIMNVTYWNHAPVKVEGFFLEPTTPKKISQEGDSGAVWHDPASGAAIGIEVALSSGDATHPGEFAFAGFVDVAFQKLGLEIA